MLLDPGYHFTTPITVMEDQLFPQSEPQVILTGDTKRVNSYKLFEGNSNYVVWNLLKSINGEEVKDSDNVILINKPFLSGLDIAERRNLVYPVKTLLNRDKRGTLTSGLYIVLKPIGSAKLTLFFNNASGEQVKVNVPMSYFLDKSPNYSRHILKERRKTLESSDLTSALTLKDVNPSGFWDGKSNYQQEWEEAIDLVAKEAGRSHEIRSVLSFVADVLNDSDFLDAIRSVNDSIVENSKNN